MGIVPSLPSALAHCLACWLSVSTPSRLVGKFFAEAIEHAHVAPVEASRAAGHPPLQVIFDGFLPQVIPQMADVSSTLGVQFPRLHGYGMVGAGGIGFELMGSLGSCSIATSRRSNCSAAHGHLGRRLERLSAPAVQMNGVSVKPCRHRHSSGSPRGRRASKPKLHGDRQGSSHHLVAPGRTRESAASRCAHGLHAGPDWMKNFRHCPNLKIVAAALKGFDNFDVEAMSRRGIWFTIVPDLLTISTAELAVTPAVRTTAGARRRSLRVQWKFYRLATEALRRRTERACRRHHRHGRRRSDHRAASRRFRCEDRVSRPPSFRTERGSREGLDRTQLEQGPKESDCVILAAPLLDAHSLHQQRTLAVMKPSSYLVNVGRGSVVDETAVARR